MRQSLLLTLSASLLFSAAPAFAQIETSEDDRFQPRVYGNLGVTQAVYTEGAKQHLENAGQVIAAPVVAETTTIRVDEPVPAGNSAVITYSAPVKIEAGIVKAQHIKPGDVSEEDYQRLLDEADRVRAFKGISATQAVQSETPQPLYEIQLFEDPVTVTAQSIDNVSASLTHNVVKGDTLYNISKRYNVSIEAIQKANALSGNAIALGQAITIPQPYITTSEMPLSINTTVAQPVMVSTETIVQAPSTIKRVVLPVEASTTSIYAVLPKDTLYSISRRTCTNVSDIIATNGIENPNALKPGQRLTLPAGHCLTQ
jgi:LysM repeat protein